MDLFDKDNEYIDTLSRITGVKYSDEQRKILMHRGGMCILASAGSGKTSILTHLLAKRIMSGEISDPSRLLCTTYSKGGATEMEVRVHKILNMVGINRNITVKTMHALYLGILREFGYPSNVLDESERKKYLREACVKNKITLDDEEFKTLDSLISYQVNNLMTDAQLVQSYVFTLQITLEEYTAIRSEFVELKRRSKRIDFDDMQMYMFTLLCTNNSSRDTLVKYCHSKWSDIYVDEAQDMSRIQYVILKQLISDPSRFVVIGDDDQCLVGGTMINTPEGDKRIEDIDPNNWVLSACNFSEPRYHALNLTHKKYYRGKIISIKTASGKSITATPDHVMFKYVGEEQNKISDKDEVQFEMFVGNCSKIGKTTKSRIVFHLKSLKFASVVNEYIKVMDISGCRYPSYIEYRDIDTDQCEDILKKIQRDIDRFGVDATIKRYAILGDNKYELIKLGDMQVGEVIPVFDNDFIEKDVIISITSENYTGYVYDLSVPGYRNFIANGIIVHNCIYQWRGADPSIILNVCADYDISRFVLSTNYRCAGNIVEKAALGIVHNSHRSDKSMKPYNPGGEIKICNSGSSNIYEMSKYAYKYIRELIMENGVRPDNIAVLSRNNNHLSILSNMLFKDGIHCETSSEMKITNSLVYRQVRDIFNFAQDKNTVNYTIQGLMGTCVFMSRANAMKFSNIQKASGGKVSDILSFIVNGILHRNIDSDPIGIKIPYTAKANMEAWVLGLKGETIENLVLIYKLLKDPDTKTRVTGMLACYISAQSWKFEKFPDKKRHVEGLVSYISDLVKTMDVKETQQLFKITEQYERGNMAVPGYKVNMTTIHGAKGKEWEHVVIFADDNISFPSFTGITSQMSKGIALSDVMYSIDEDRRLHYVAMTRAKKELAIFTDSKNPGVFLLESMGIFDYGLQNNAHIISMAQSGEVYNQLITDAESQLFNKDSKYSYIMDVSELKADIDIDYLYLGNPPDETKSISIDDIQTGETF